MLSCLNVPREIIVWIEDIFDNSFGIENYFTKSFKESFVNVLIIKHFSIKYLFTIFLPNIFYQNLILIKYFDNIRLFWLP